jgi:hypothetical protein
MEFAGGLDHREEKSLLFERPIGPAAVAEEVGPADFEPDEIVRVVDDAHLIGLRVPDADA